MSASTTNNAVASYDTLDSTYVMHYFGLHGLGAGPRAVLALAGVQWEDRIQDRDTWPQIKASQPCATLPVLIETTSAGGVIHVPESEAIERYLGRKYGFMGKNAHEDIDIDVYYSQAHSLQTKFVQRVLWAPTEDARAQSFKGMIADALPAWIQTCEKRLAEQGNTGYFVGGRLTLADIRTAVVLDAILPLGEESIGAYLSEKASPGLWQLKKNVDSHKGYKEFRQGEGYKKLDQGTQFGFSQKIPSFDITKSHIIA